MPARLTSHPRSTRGRAWLVLALLATLGLSACGDAGEPDPAVASARAEGNAALCSVLTPADFAAAGIDGAGEPDITTDEVGAYCVYAGESGATGGIELDVFRHADQAAAHETYATVVAEAPAGETPPGPSFDEAAFAVAGDVLILTGRQGSTVVTLAVPGDAATIESVASLARLAADRATALGR